MIIYYDKFRYYAIVAYGTWQLPQHLGPVTAAATLANKTRTTL